MRYGFRIRCRPSPLYRICLPMDGGERQALLVDGELREVDKSTSPRRFGSSTFQRCSIHHPSFLRESSQFSLLIISLTSLCFINWESNDHRSTTWIFLYVYMSAALFANIFKCKSADKCTRLYPIHAYIQIFNILIKYLIFYRRYLIKK